MTPTTSHRHGSQADRLSRAAALARIERRERAETLTMLRELVTSPWVRRAQAGTLPAKEFRP
mgnify:CR=1 FL=1